MKQICLSTPTFLLSDNELHNERQLSPVLSTNSRTQDLSLRDCHSRTIEPLATYSILVLLILVLKFFPFFASNLLLWLFNIVAVGIIVGNLKPSVIEAEKALEFYCPFDAIELETFKNDDKTECDDSGFDANCEGEESDSFSATDDDDDQAPEDDDEDLEKRIEEFIAINTGQSIGVSSGFLEGNLVSDLRNVA